jgi:signal transduction histidine kinase
MNDLPVDPRDQALQFHAMLDRVRDPVFLLDRAGKVAFGNRAFELAFGREGGVSSPQWSAWIHAKDLPSFLYAMEKAWAGEESTCRARWGGRTDEARWQEFRFLPLEPWTANGEPAVMGFAHDVHDWIAREALSSQLQQARKMEALGNLAGMVSHEFTNLVGGIASLVDYALGKMPADAPQRRDWEVMGKAAQRALALAGNLQAMAGRRLLSREAIDLAKVVRDLAEEWQAEHPAEPLRVDVRVEKAICPGNAAQLHQILRNLLKNAREATARPEEGGLELTLEALEPVPGGNLAWRIAVMDRGHGIPEEIMDRIFEPYFSSKRSKGSGLGLGIAYGLAQRHQGRLRAENREGGGACFTLDLPGVGDPSVPAQ